MRFIYVIYFKSISIDSIRTEPNRNMFRRPLLSFSHSAPLYLLSRPRTTIYSCPVSQSSSIMSQPRRITRSAARAAASSSLPPPIEDQPVSKKRRTAASSTKKSSRTNKAVVESTIDAAAKPKKKATKKAKSDDEDISVENDLSAKAQPKKSSRKKKVAAETVPAAGDELEGNTTTAPEATKAKTVRKKKAKIPVAEPHPDEYIETTCDKPWGSCDSTLLKVVTWNITSARTMYKNGQLLSYIEREQPDLLLVQETKLTEVAAKELTEIAGYDVHWNHSTAKKGYSGVGIFISRQLLADKNVSVDSVTPGMGEDEADGEGRVLTAVLSNNLTVVNAYVPNAGGKLKRLEYRTETWEPAMRKFLGDLDGPVIYSGDLNCAHNEIDIHNSKGNQKSSGHTPEERKEFSNMLADGWSDVLREKYPHKRTYTYYSKRFGDRMQRENKGWRLDYHLANQPAVARVEDIFTRFDQGGSDHLPHVLLIKV